MNEQRNVKQDVVALLQLLRYAREEAASLGLVETARLVDLPAASCIEEATALFGLSVDDDGFVIDWAQLLASD